MLKWIKAQKNDCKVWKTFLESEDQLQMCRPFVDLNAKTYANVLNFYSDASLNENFGFGVLFKNRWTYGRWGKDFVKQQKPSIEFLELFALVAGILLWGEDKDLTNMRAIVFCDNEAVVNMVNNSTSKCPKCMKLIRILIFNCMLHNRCIFVNHVRTEKNILADSLSHMNFTRFWKNAPAGTSKYPDEVPHEIWLIEKVWFD